MPDIFFEAFVSGRTALTSGTLAPATDLLPVVRSGVTYQATPEAIVNAQLSTGIDATFSQLAATHATLGWLTGSQTFGGTITGAFAPLNILQITDSIAVPGGSAQGLYIQHHVGGATATGGRVAIQGDMVAAAATGNTNGQYVAIQGNAFLPAGISEPGGVVYGGNFTAQLFANASVGTTVGYVVGTEINVGGETGTVSRAYVGLSIVPFGNWSVPGTAGRDVGLGFGDQGQTGGGWDVLISLDGTGGGHLPIKTTGTIFGVGSAGTVAKGIDFTNLTITGNAWTSATVQIFGANDGNNTSFATSEGITLGYGVSGGADVNIITSNNSNILFAPGGSAYVRSGANLRVQPIGAANYFTIAGGNGGSGATAPTLYTQGSTTDIDFNIKTQGLGSVRVYSNGGSNQILNLEGSTATDGWARISAGIAASAPVQLSQNGAGNNILIGGTSLGTGAIATSSTTGFAMITFSAGAPTGTVVNNTLGCALHYDTTNNQIYVNNAGTWKKTVALT